MPGGRLRRPMPLLLLLLLLAPTTAGLAVELDPPSHVPTDGSPFQVTVGLQDLPPGEVDLKAWIGPGEKAASRTWNGTAWQRSDRYAITFGPEAPRTLQHRVGLRVNPQGTHAPDLQASSHGTVGVRLRTAQGTHEATVTVPTLHAPAHVPVAASQGTVVRAQGPGFAVSWRQNAPGTRVIELPVPDGLDARVCSGGRCEPARGVLLQAAGEHRALLVNPTLQALDLTGAVVALPGGRCPVAGELAPGQRLLVGAPLEHAPAGVGTLACDPDGPGAQTVAVHHLGSVLDTAEPPGWGWAVRRLDPTRGWALWPRPVGVLAETLEPSRVVGTAHPFVTSEEGYRTVRAVVEAARERVTVATYLFTHEGVAGALAAAAQRGVRVHVVVEEHPVGGRPTAEDALLDQLARAGVNVTWAKGPWPGVQHGKVIVADGFVSLVLTENLTGSGLPVDGDGNVGWGLGITNRTLAARLEAVYGVTGPARPWTPAGWWPLDAPVAVVLSPEATPDPAGVPALIRQARGELVGLSLTAGTNWREAPNPWLEALVDASRRVPVRVLLNGVAHGESPSGANRPAIAHLMAHPARGALEARASTPATGRVHAKGLASQGWAMVGSSNWGAGGALWNREVNLVVWDARLAAFYRGAFEHAWTSDGGQGVLEAPGPGAGLAAVGASLTALFLAGSARPGARGGREAGEEGEETGEGKGPPWPRRPATGRWAGR